MAPAEHRAASQPSEPSLLSGRLVLVRDGAVRDVPLTGPIQVSIFGTAVDWELT